MGVDFDLNYSIVVSNIFWWIRLLWLFELKLFSYCSILLLLIY
jgi:hypothetical protein